VGCGECIIRVRVIELVDWMGGGCFNRNDRVLAGRVARDVDVDVGVRECCFISEHIDQLRNSMKAPRYPE
jgi:hypothetical protein